MQIFTRLKAPFVDVPFSDSHETAAYYAPIQSDRPRLYIQDEQPLKFYDLLHVTEKPADQLLTYFTKQPPSSHAMVEHAPVLTRFQSQENH